MEKYLTSADVAAQLGVSVRTVTRASLRHGIGVKLGRFRVYTSDDVVSLRPLVNPGYHGNMHLQEHLKAWKAKQGSGQKSAKKRD